MAASMRYVDFNGIDSEETFVRRGALGSRRAEHLVVHVTCILKHY